MKLDVENRIFSALKELLLANTDITALVSTRVYRHNSAAHVTNLPCITINIPSCAGFEPRLGWYSAAVQLCAHVHIKDDTNLDVANSIIGQLRGIVQTTTLPTTINNTTSAKASTTALTVIDAQYSDFFEGEDEGNARMFAVVVGMVCRPSVGDNQG